MTQNRFRIQFASDVGERDGLGAELITEQGLIVAEVFRSDDPRTAATCFLVAALLINGALATWEDSRPGGFDNPSGSEKTTPMSPILATVAIAFGVLLTGAWIQIG